MMKVGFIASFLPIVDGDIGINVDNTNDNSLYIMINLTIQYTILSSDAGGTIVMIPRSPLTPEQQTLGMINPWIIDGINKIKEGQIVDIQKVIYNDDTSKPTYQRACLGFVEVVEYRKSNQGVLCIIQYKQLLTQLTLLPAAQTLQQESATGVEYMGLLANEAPVQALTNGCLKNSLMAVAQGKNLYSNSADVNVFDIQAILPEKVWIYSDLNTSRDTVLRQALAPFNTIMWQDQDGTVYIQQLSLSNVNNDWTVKDGDFQSITCSNAAGRTPNQLVQYYMIPALLEPFSKASSKINSTTRAVVTPSETYYPREHELYKTNNFTYGILTGKSIDNGVLQNVQDLTYLGGDPKQKISKNGYLTIGGQTITVAEMYGQQEMAQILVGSHMASVMYALTPERLALELPLGQIINMELVDDFLYDKQMLCHSAAMNWNLETGATLMLECCNLLSVTGLWSK